jgi:ribonucleotide reductase alpha subunit
MVPIDSIKVLKKIAAEPLTVSKESKHKGLNWDILRAKVKKGMRNATLMAVAPNANIGLVAGTTPGIDPRFAQVFSRNKISGKYLDINHNLVKDLKNMGLWDKVKDQIIENQGDISNIAIPHHLKDIYKTSFTTSPYAFIEVAARAQKWVDQALSRNMYLETRDIDETMRIYQTAWDKGLKSTYYFHMKPRHTAEQSTTAVNNPGGLFHSAASTEEVSAKQEVKQEIKVAQTQNPVTTHVADKANESNATQKASHSTLGLARTKGFVSLQSLKTELKQKPNIVPSKNAPKVCPTDPSDKDQCDSCQ